MQNSQPNRERTLKVPRRARRGALMPAAMLAVLVITILMSQFAGAQLRQASAARSEARAVQLAVIAADFDYYVHANSIVLDTSLSGAGSSGRPLTEWERATFEREFLRIGVARHIHGFDLDYLISRGSDGHEVFGALRISALDERGRAEMCTIIARLARHGAEYQGPTNTDTTGGCDTANISDLLIPTAPLSGVNPTYVLRAPRAGHPAPKLLGSGALDLNGHNLTVRNLTATGGDESAATEIVGALYAREMTGTLTSVSVKKEDNSDAGDDDVAAQPDEIRNVEIAGTTRVSGAFEISGRLDAGTLTSSGDLVIGGNILIQDWVKTDRLNADTADFRSHLTTPRIVINGTASISSQLSTDALQSPTVVVSKEFTARQVFTKNADVVDLDITGKCHGC